MQTEIEKWDKMFEIEENKIKFCSILTWHDIYKVLKKIEDYK